MTEEYVYCVDENDNVLGKVTRKEMRTKILRHRGCNIFVFNSKGEILVHKRTMSKDLFPGYYSFVVGGSVQYGESYDECASRELKEETGVRKKPIFLFKYYYDGDKTKSWVHVYKVISDGPFNFQKEEVTLARFVSLDEVRKIMKREKVCNDDIVIFNKYMKECHDKT